MSNHGLFLLCDFCDAPIQQIGENDFPFRHLMFCNDNCASLYVADLQIATTDRAHDSSKAAGRRGGLARAAKLSPERRSEIARHAANARFGNAPPRDATEGANAPPLENAAPPHTTNER